jgi:hypothetical protein
LTDENGGRESVEGDVRPRYFGWPTAMDPFAWRGDLRIAAVGEVLDGKLAALFEHLGIAAPDHVLTGHTVPTGDPP